MLLMIIEDNQPFKTVEDTGFTCWIKFYHQITLNQLAQSLLRFYFLDFMKKWGLKPFIKWKIQIWDISLDTWTLLNKVGFLGITFFFSDSFID